MSNFKRKHSSLGGPLRISVKSSFQQDQDYNTDSCYYISSINSDILVNNYMKDNDENVNDANISNKLSYSTKSNDKDIEECDYSLTSPHKRKKLTLGIPLRIKTPSKYDSMEDNETKSSKYSIDSQSFQSFSNKEQNVLITTNSTTTINKTNNYEESNNNLQSNIKTQALSISNIKNEENVEEDLMKGCLTDFYIGKPLGIYNI